MNELLQKIEQANWKQMWAGDWNMINATDWGEYYYESVGMKKIVFLIEAGKISAWSDRVNIDEFAKRMLKKHGNSIEKIKALSVDLKSKTDTVLQYMDENRENINRDVYLQSVKNVREYYIPHIALKYMADYLDPQNVDEYLPILEEARVYAEPVFTETINFDKQLVEQIAKKEKIKEVNNLLYMTLVELKEYFDSGNLPNMNDLENRKNKSVVIFLDSKTPVIFTEGEAEEVISLVSKIEDVDILRGKTAFQGKVKGRVRIIMDPGKPGDFAEGDILVTSMTRPEYLQLMKKSGAVITEAGGILSHAAITAREIKKPCVIGTMTATKFLKDGDMVEVDADNGIIKKL